MDIALENRAWWNFINEDLRELLKEAVLLVDNATKWEEDFHDYAFVVFPAAKAYEGFLKTLFHELRLISDEDFYGKKFRVGKALNPALEFNLREKEGVYHKLVEFCQGRQLADNLWETWKEGRNLLFHWFPNEKNAISFEEAKRLFVKILNTMDLAFKECKIDR